ncbi:protein kinase domain-containing protein [Caldisalinibacter kiritimatiensis]|uniref:Protein kinase domain-containing protein n=1 Tax=Caldisalinibacter kiritimatiensis TaxID=1304284 RepID=R1AVB2_9FIRM|nr:AarF/UbiB family protein [Caldisalinibacter kiritimatiensis]EOD01138.1 hypothetical protein L21TH_0806 [Caldisalinibacter kiritimatiensis]
MIGKVITGKWNNNKYKVLKEIGRGSIGVVYKVTDDNGNVKALKISKDFSSITREYNNIKRLKGYKFVPRVYELDDYKEGNNTFNFFVMEYIYGDDLKAFIKKHNFNEKDVLGIGIILLDILQKAYKEGCLYGDLKLENILIDKKNSRVMLVDFGGLIDKDKCLKEYTPTYNPTSWDIKSDIDKQATIIFSISMLMTSMILKKEFSPFKYTLKDVISIVKALKVNEKLKKTIIKGLNVKYKSIRVFKNDLKMVLDCLKSNKNTRAHFIDAVDIFLISSICFFVFVIVIVFTRV